MDSGVRLLNSNACSFANSDVTLGGYLTFKSLIFSFIKWGK